MTKIHLRTKHATADSRINVLKALLDSGATRHVTGDKHLLRNTSPEAQVSLSGVLEEVKFDTVKGNIYILLPNNTLLQLKDVVYVPMLKEKQTIISESMLIDDGYAIHKDQQKSTLTKNGYTVSTFERQNGHFFLHGTNNPENNIGILQLNISATDLMHYRLGHINDKYILSTGFKPMTQSYCIGCSAGKLVQKNKGKTVNYDTSKLWKATYPWEKIHLDTIGKLPSSINNFKYICLIVCNYSGYLTPIIVKNKSNISGLVKKFIKRVRKLHNKPVKHIFSDRGTEFTKLNEYCLKKNIIKEYSNEYFPSEKGKIERQNRTLLEMMRAFLIQANISEKYWCYCANHSCNIINSITRKNGTSSYKLVFNKDPQLEELKLFRARGHALLSKKRKFQTTIPIIYLGQDNESKANICINCKNGKIVRVRTTKLDEVGTINSAYEKFIHQTSRYSSTSNTSKIEKVVQHITKNILQIQENIEEAAELSDDDHSKE
eukprot:snap_masked-scaffold_1-processed-gene-15.29-mRNA-1 protein AED:1.00 eAED:1.00 QI:0/0/0/0/1/1/2/0/489